MIPRQYGIISLAIAVYVVAIGCEERSYLAPPPQTTALNSYRSEEAPSLSHDGRYLVFTSDRGGQRGIFLYDLRERKAIDLPGLNRANSIQDQPDISADGRYIAYISEERGKPDVFVYDRLAFESEIITENLLGEVRAPAISGNGRFATLAANRQGQWDIEVYDRGAGIDLSLPFPAESPN